MKLQSAFILVTTAVLVQLCLGSETVKVAVTIDTTAIINNATTEFPCVTMDWWPADSCRHGECPWGQSSILNMNLDDANFLAAMERLAPVYLRLGGTLEDNIVYEVGSPLPPCNEMHINTSMCGGYSLGCLNMSRWTEINQMCEVTGCKIVFGLNYLYGRTQVGTKSYTGAWDPTNTEALFAYMTDPANDFPQNTVAFELGNELVGSSGVCAKLDPVEYGNDMKVLKSLIAKYWPEPSTRPAIIGGDTGFNAQSFSTFLDSCGPDTLDVFNYHDYPLGYAGKPQEELIEEMLNVTIMDEAIFEAQEVATVMTKYSPASQLWMGEDGGAWGSGSLGVTDRFVSAFWYLDEMGGMAQNGYQKFCRQSFNGGGYGLLNYENYTANPDYYATLLWKALMGSSVLSLSVTGEHSLRAYAHCSELVPGAVTALFINPDNETSYSILPSFETVSSQRLRGQVGSASYSVRYEYQMVPTDGTLTSASVSLNGVELVQDGPILPILAPVVKSSREALVIAPQTYAFIVFVDAPADVCSL